MIRVFLGGILVFAGFASRSESSVGLVSLPTISHGEIPATATCGDSRCEPPEDCNTCPSDCGSCCGDGRCAPPEDCHSCSRDCGPCR